VETLTPDHVQAALHAWHLSITIRFFPHSTATSSLAAEAIGCEVGQIAKSLCYVVEDQPILVIASGDQRVDDRKLAALLGVPRKRGYHALLQPLLSDPRRPRPLVQSHRACCASAGVQKFEQVRRKHIRLTRQKILAGSIACGRYHRGFRS